MPCSSAGSRTPEVSEEIARAERQALRAVFLVDPGGAPRQADPNGLTPKRPERPKVALRPREPGPGGHLKAVLRPRTSPPLPTAPPEPAELPLLIAEKLARIRQLKQPPLPIGARKRPRAATMPTELLDYTRLSLQRMIEDTRKQLAKLREEKDERKDEDGDEETNEEKDEEPEHAPPQVISYLDDGIVLIPEPAPSQKPEPGNVTLLTVDLGGSPGPTVPPEGKRPPERRWPSPAREPTSPDWNGSEDGT